MPGRFVSAQIVGDRKRRRAERETGLTIDRLLRLSNRSWEARVVEEGGHRHRWIDPLTWEHGPSTDACWSSCDTPRLDADVVLWGWTPIGSAGREERMDEARRLSAESRRRSEEAVREAAARPRRRLLALPHGWSPWGVGSESTHNEGEVE